MLGLNMKVGDKIEMNDGVLEILSINGWSNVKVRFVDSGYKTTVFTTHIKNKNVRDRFKPNILGVGYIGGTKYKSSEKGKITPAYQCWKSMLYRCYNEAKREEYPTYYDCYVCDEWHNFQNFAEWYYKNIPNEKDENGNVYELDKDIRVSGNKVYGPESCLFVKHSDNVRKASCKKYNVKDPDGNIVEIYGMRKFCLEKGLDPSAMTKVAKGIIKYHKGWTPPWI